MMARGLFVGGGIIGGGAAGWLDARYARRFEAIPNSALVGFGLLGVGLWLDDDFWSDGMLGFGVGMVSPAAYSFMAERTTAKAVGDGA